MTTEAKYGFGVSNGVIKFNAEIFPLFYQVLSSLAALKSPLAFVEPIKVSSWLILRHLKLTPLIISGPIRSFR